MNTIQKIKLIIFGLVLAFGLNYADAQTWRDPSGRAAPFDNIDAPVHVLSGLQIKDGGLSVNTFVAAQNAQFNQQLFLRGIIRGGFPGDGASTSTVTFGGNGKTVSGDVSGTLSANKYLQSLDVDGYAETQLCADQNGNVIAC